MPDPRDWLLLVSYSGARIFSEGVRATKKKGLRRTGGESHLYVVTRGEYGIALYRLIEKIPSWNRVLFPAPKCIPVLNPFNQAAEYILRYYLYLMLNGQLVSIPLIFA